MTRPTLSPCFGTAILISYPRSNQLHVRFDPPHYDHEYGIVSAVTAQAGPNAGRDETYIFPADEHGNVTAYQALVGSFRGARDLQFALTLAGYGYFAAESINPTYTEDAGQ